MKKNFKYFGVVAAIIAVTFTSCEDLEVENLNEKNSSDIFSDPTTFPSVVDGAFLTWWQATQLSSPNMPISVYAQTLSSSWGNWGMRDLGTIPRAPIQNTLTYNNRAFMTTPWARLNQSLAQVNDLLRVMNSEFGGTIDDGNGNDLTNQVLANGKLAQGLALGTLGLIFDQAFIADETVSAIDLGTLELSPYTDVVAAAITKLTEAAAIFDGDASTTHSAINGLNYDNVEAARFARSFAAKILAYSSRDAAEAAANDWNQILSLTANTVTADISPAGDGVFWWTRILIQGQFPLWTRVSQRIINMMEGGTGSGTTSDPSNATAPYPWPDGTNTLPEITAPRDARISTDFVYNSGVQFAADRGYYFYSSYNFNKYNYYIAALLGPMPHLTMNEIGMIRAEALIRTGGSKTEAAALINATRVTRGGLTALTGTESDADMLKEITYERLVEFAWDGALNGWYFRRIASDPSHFLQPGTASQLPLPAQELEILGLDVYTFGG
ncbi:RagB/SusD family nutrient uptake outer membrane protein [Roseivirga sp.]|uniref:RagB/SusD family nutrient uptake outer membrane protein n=1 Tax=Roseivirga sp. TaxID=1964215 RepID=UPI003B8C409D